MGPAPDYTDFGPLITQAHQRIPLHRVLADAGYDSEANLQLALETLRIPQCIIRLHRRNRGRKWPLAPLRRALRRCFPRLLYRQRWLIESQISAHKRRLGSILFGRLQATRFAQALIRILVHNLALLLLLRVVFNRAWTEYELAVHREHDTHVLAQLLLPVSRNQLTPDTLIPILSKLEMLCPDSVGVVLALAIGLDFTGKSDEAFELISRVKLSAPIDLDVLHSELSVSFSANDDSRMDLCEEVLRIYPTDQYALNILRNLKSGKRSETLDTRALYDRALREVQSGNK